MSGRNVGGRQGRGNPPCHPGRRITGGERLVRVATALAVLILLALMLFPATFPLGFWTAP